MTVSNLLLVIKVFTLFGGLFINALPPNKPLKGKCSTVDGQQCVFPFRFNGFTYNECTWHYSTYPWCSTQVDNDTGRHIGGTKGACGVGCDIQAFSGDHQKSQPPLSSESEINLLKDIFIIDLGCSNISTVDLRYVCGWQVDWKTLPARNAISYCTLHKAKNISLAKSSRAICEDPAWNGMKGVGVADLGDRKEFTISSPDSKSTLGVQNPRNHPDNSGVTEIVKNLDHFCKGHRPSQKIEGRKAHCDGTFDCIDRSDESGCDTINSDSDIRLIPNSGYHSISDLMNLKRQPLIPSLARELDEKKCGGPLLYSSLYPSRCPDHYGMREICNHYVEQMPIGRNCYPDTKICNWMDSTSPDFFHPEHLVLCQNYTYWHMRNMSFFSLVEVRAGLVSDIKIKQSEFEEVDELQSPPIHSYLHPEKVQPK